MATDFNRIRQLVTALVDIQAMEAAFAQTGANAPTIGIAFTVDHPQVGTPQDMMANPPMPASSDYKPASTEQFSFSFTLPADVAAAAAAALASAVTTAMGAMNLPTS